MEQTECSETSAYNIQASGNHSKERTQQTSSDMDVSYWRDICIAVWEIIELQIFMTVIDHD